MSRPESLQAFGPDLVLPADLVRKLEHDFRRLQGNPRDTYAAFDFFVTAEHIPDWMRNIPVKREIPLLRVVSHLAAGAKHFIPQDKRHQSVRAVEVEGGAFQADAFQADAFDVGSLVVQLQGDEAALFGTEVGVLQLAELVLQYWREQVGAANAPIQPTAESGG